MSALLGGLALAACSPAPPGAVAPSGSASTAAAMIAVGSRPGVPAIGDGAVWVPNTGDGTVSRIDPRVNRVVATISIADPAPFYQQNCAAYGSVHSFMVTTFNVRLCDLPSAVATGPGAVWGLRNDTDALVRIDPSVNRVTTTIALGAAPYDLAATTDAVWITSYIEDEVIRVDPSTNRVVARLPGFSPGPTSVAIGAGAVWIVSSRAGTLSRIDPARNRVDAVIPLPCASACMAGPRPLAITLAPDAIWVRNEGNSTLARVDPLRNAVVDTVAVDAFYGRDGLDAIGVTAASLWLGGVSLQQLDARTGRLRRRSNQTATAVVASGATLWLTDITGRVVRIDAAH